MTPPPSLQELIQTVQQDSPSTSPLDLLITASSTVTGFLEVAGLERLPPVVACIGPITAATAQKAGIRVDAVAEEHSIGGLLAALVSVLKERATAASR